MITVKIPKQSKFKWKHFSTYSKFDKTGLIKGTHIKYIDRSRLSEISSSNLNLFILVIFGEYMQ